MQAATEMMHIQQRCICKSSRALYSYAPGFIGTALRRPSQQHFQVNITRPLGPVTGFVLETPPKDTKGTKLQQPSTDTRRAKKDRRFPTSLVRPRDCARRVSIPSEAQTQPDTSKNRENHNYQPLQFLTRIFFRDSCKLLSMEKYRKSTRVAINRDFPRNLLTIDVFILTTCSWDIDFIGWRLESQTLSPGVRSALNKTMTSRTPFSQTRDVAFTELNTGGRITVKITCQMSVLTPAVSIEGLGNSGDSGDGAGSIGTLSFGLNCL
ncbi:hypothetical protein BZA77DRAFT_294499 [Pyronema omphalodes]|nr:hypothetical protein BZA77DRAFT_294499 [Pyronema omphalodes]